MFLYLILLIIYIVLSYVIYVKRRNISTPEEFVNV